MDWAKTTVRRDDRHLSFKTWCDLYYRFYGSQIWFGKGFGAVRRNEAIPWSNRDQFLKRHKVSEGASGQNQYHVRGSAYTIPHHEMCCPRCNVITSTNGKNCRVTGPLWGESTGHRWIPLTKASDAKLWYFFDVRMNKRLSKQNREAGDLNALTLIVTSL